MAKAGPEIPFGLTERRAQGEVEAIPTLPLIEPPPRMILPEVIVGNNCPFTVGEIKSYTLLNTLCAFVLTRIFPFTSSFAPGAAVPMPTVPLPAMYSELALAAWLTEKAALLPAVKPPEKVLVAVVEVAK